MKLSLLLMVFKSFAATRENNCPIENRCTTKKTEKEMEGISIIYGPFVKNTLKSRKMNNNL